LASVAAIVLTAANTLSRQKMTERILITGATGNTGRVIAAELLGRVGPELSIVAMARGEASRARLAARGLPTVHGDFDDPASLVRALAGVTRAYLVCTPDERLIARETAFITAARAAGVRHIVKCSAYMADIDGETQNLRSHGVIERALRDSGLEYTVLRPHGFMQTFTLFAWDMIERAGVISNPTGDGGLPLVDVRDVARVAVKALTEPGHSGKVYDLTGPEALTGARMAELLERVLGRPISYLPAAPAPFAVIMRLLGVPPTPREHVVKIMRMTREHRLERVHGTLAELGVGPTCYEEFLRDLVAGRTGGGNSFEAPTSAVFTVLSAVMPVLMRLRFRVFGRPRRSAA
jgi:uncharacterized protein YbjT (DUF2867 family)